MSNAPKKSRRYHELLTPLLHRRFASAATLVLGTCYVETLLIRSWSSKFWWFFPIGFAGVQTLLFFIPGLLIFILRVAQVHFGLRTSPSPAHTSKQLFLSASTWWTLVVYIVFGFFYGEVYMWTAPASADLSWVKEGRTYERMVLNERPIFLRSNFFLLSLMQVVYHLWWDVSRIKLPRVDPAFQHGTGAGTTAIPPAQRIRDSLVAMVVGAAGRAGVATFCNLFIYAMALRRTAYQWSRDIGRIVWNISRNAEPNFVPPYHWTLLVRAFVSGILMIFLIDFSNQVFTLYLAQEPSKKDKPLSEDSPDPNGSLLNGLNSKREFVRTFAFWELHTIASHFADRRRAIFQDLDRSGGSTWTQILQVSLCIIESVDTRITNKAIPPPEMTLVKQRTTPERLPRIVAPLEQGTIMSPAAKTTSRTASYEAKAASLARSLGSSPGNGSGSALRSSLTSARDHLLSADQQQMLAPQHLSASILHLLQAVLRTPLGVPFRQTFANRARAKALGTPYSELEITCFAIGSIARLAAASVQEDMFGTVNRDVASILRALARVTGSVDVFVRTNSNHWTDVDSRENEHANGNGNGSANANANNTYPPDREVREIEDLLTHLRCALQFLIASFEGYAKDMGLSEVELREARKAAGLIGT